MVDRPAGTIGDVKCPGLGWMVARVAGTIGANIWPLPRCELDGGYSGRGPLLLLSYQIWVGRRVRVSGDPLLLLIDQV
jgi:hypothetical protein